MLRLPRHPATWFAAFLVWFGVLWHLSSQPGIHAPPPFPHSDKLAHFSYFAIGGFLFAACHFRLRHSTPAWEKILATAIIGIALIGWLDEWHQCFTPGRSGADPWDWLADLLGGAAGAFLLKSLHHRLQ
jgi:VanZ family protein